jgi:hypothetical protein
MEPTVTAPAILRAISAVQAAIAKTGIAKARKNQQQGYSFRGIDDMYNDLSPLLSENGVVILPRYRDITVTEHHNAKGTVLFYVRLLGEFTLRSSQDGSSVLVSTYGEAMDSGDKATNKAMSTALKYALMQTLTIPTEGDNDTENTSHEVAAKGKREAAPAKQTTLTAERIATLHTKMGECKTTDELATFWKSLNEEEQKVCAKLKDSLKVKLTPAKAESSSNAAPSGSGNAKGS